MEFIEIDGSQGEGGGQILRTSVSLSSILGIPIRIKNIRAGRKEPGLKPQHLQAVKSAAEISNAKLSGAQVGSTLIEFTPGSPQKRVTKMRIETGTAGSVTLIAQTLIPIGIFRGLDLDLEIVGGTEVPASPTIDYLQRIVLPIYERIGGKLTIELEQRGYYPKGGGLIRVRVNGSASKPSALRFETDVGGKISRASIIAVSRLLPDHISEREIKTARDTLYAHGIEFDEVITDSKGSARSPGNSILISRQGSNHFIGGTALGEKGKSSEQVGHEAAENFLMEANGSPHLDSHLADMATTLLACVPGNSSFTTSRITKHLETNLVVSEKMAGIKYKINEIREKKIWKVELASHAEKSI